MLPFEIEQLLSLDGTDPYCNYSSQVLGIAQFLNRMSVGNCKVVVRLDNLPQSYFNYVTQREMVAAFYTAFPFSKKGKNEHLLIQLPILPFADKRFDTLALFNIFDRIEVVKDDLLLEARRVVNHRLLISAFIPYNQRSDKLAIFDRQLIKCGFEISHLEPQYIDGSLKKKINAIIPSFYQKLQMKRSQYIKFLTQIGFVQFSSPDIWLISADVKE